MEYMLNVKENTIFGFSRDKMQSNGYIEYFDTANPFGLLKLNFILLSTNPSELKLFPMGNTEDFSKKACNDAIDIFEEIEKKIVEKGILPKTAVIVGINFFNNPALNIQEQLYRFYVYPNRPRSYCVRIPRGLTKYLFRGDNEERPRGVYPSHLQQRQQPRNTEDRNNQQRHQQGKKPHKKKHHHQNQQQQAVTPVSNDNVVDDDKLDALVNGNLGAPIYNDVTENNDLPPISDEAVATAIANLELVDEPDASEETITLTTDTGISEDFSQKDYNAAVAAQEEVGTSLPETAEPEDEGQTSSIAVNS